jgi:hypothetical protein
VGVVTVVAVVVSVKVVMMMTSPIMDNGVDDDNFSYKI